MLDITNGDIQALALMHGFKLKEQKNKKLDLNPYVYDFARALINLAETGVSDGAIFLQETIDYMLNEYEAFAEETHLIKVDGEWGVFAEQKVFDRFADAMQEVMGKD